MRRVGSWRWRDRIVAILMLAAQPDTFIRRLVMNDVGPLVPSTFEHLSTCASLDLEFDTTDEIETYLRDIYRDSAT